MGIKKSFCVAKAEYVKWICNPKMLIFVVMFIFAYDMIIDKMLVAAKEMNTQLMVAEPFIAISNSVLLQFVIPSVFLALMGDFPKIDGNSMFYLQRAGKKNWLIGQLLFSFMASCSYVGMVMITSCVSIATRCTYTNNWSLVITKYSKFFPNKQDSFVVSLITGRLYNNLRPYEAMLLSAVLMILYMTLISMMLMTGFSIGKRTLNLGIIGVVLCIGSVLIQSSKMEKWLFPAAHTLPWIHYDLIYNKQIFPITYSIGYMIIFILVLFSLNCLLVDRYDFSKIEEMEE